MPPRKKRRKVKPQRLYLTEVKAISKGRRKTVGRIPFVSEGIAHTSTQDERLTVPPTVPLPENPVHQEFIATEEGILQQDGSSQHQKRKEDTFLKWNSIMEDLHTAHVLQQGCPSDQFCRNCDIQLGDEASSVKCDDCLRFMCTECAQEVHSHLPFHDPKVWDKDGSCKSFPYKRILTAYPHLCNGYRLQNDIDVVDETGKIFICTVEYCSCIKLPIQLVSLGFWPSSPSKPTRAYHQGFLSLLEYLMLEGHMSLYASCQSLMWKNKWTTKMTDSVYRQLSTEECLAEFRHFNFQMRTLEGLCSEDECPACPKNGGTTFLSLDANFGLVRKQNAGKSVEGAKHGNQLFIDDQEVAEFVREYNINTGKNDNSDCHQFQAGDSVRSKNKALRLDKTGVFGAACRHGFPCKFLNMEHGERYAYPVLTLKKLIQEKQETSVVVSYDISCKFKAHLEKMKHTEILEHTRLVLPCWHAYGHSAACQVMYSTRWVEGCGLTDGEEMERVWSYLRPFSHITKEMTPSHRIDLLSDALLHYGRKKCGDIVDSVKQRAEKAQMIKQQAVQQLLKLLDGTYTFADVTHWKEAEKAQLNQNKSKVKLSWKEEYISKLQTYQHIRDQLAVADGDTILIINQHCENLNIELQNHERKNGVQKRWVESDQEYKENLEKLEIKQKTTLIKKLKHDVAEYHFMLETQKKYSDGQAIATRIKKQVEKASRAINNDIVRYNSNNFITSVQLPRQLLRKDVVNVEHDIYRLLDEDSSSGVNKGFQRQAIGLLNMAERAEEEETLIQREKRDVVRHYEERCERLQSELSRISGRVDRYSKGRLSLILQKMAELKDNTRKACEAFGHQT